MSTTLIRRSVIADIDGEDFTVRDGTATLDERAVPYASAQLELPLLDDATLEWLDHRNDVRVPFTVGHPDDPAPRQFDLGLRDRRVNHNSKTVTLVLGGDELILMDYHPLVVDTGARAHEASARAVTNYVLGKIGAALEAGTDDANVTAYWELTNLFTNPAPSGTTGYSAGSGTSAVANATFASRTSIRWTTSGTGISYLNIVSGFSVDPTKTYVLAGEFGSSVSRAVGWMARWIDADGATIKDTTTSTVTTSTSAWGRLVVVLTPPQSAAKVNIYARSTTNTSGQFHYLSRAMFYEGTETVTYFDGGTSLTGYTCTWVEGANTSASTRTPTVERLPELFDWPPKTSAWDFLLAILTAVGLVLWCDEQRRWFLSTPEHRVIGDQVNVNASTAREGEDELSRDNPDAFATGVIVHYEWTDRDGNRREQYDTAGTAVKPIIIEQQRPYPGPGAAAAILARRQGTGRAQRVNAIARWGTTPGMSCQISLPGAPETLGRVTAVTFDLRSGFMELGASGLIDVATGDWLAAAADLDWDDVSTTLNWEDA